MKDLEKALHKYFDSGAIADLPDVTTDNVLRINVTPDGYHSIDKGGKIYVIKKDGTDYSIYRAHLSKNNAVLTRKHEPEVVSGFYLDEVPVVLSNDGNVFFDERDTRSSYSIMKRVSKFNKRGSFDLLYYVLSAFLAYTYSIYQFSEAYASLVVPPVEYGSFTETTTPVTPSPTPTPSEPSHDGAGTQSDESDSKGKDTTDNTDKSATNQ